MRKSFEPGFKAKVALEALKGEKTAAQISSEFDVHATQIAQWKQELIQGAADIFAKPDNTQAIKQQEEIDQLHKTIGEITMENKWFKKKLQPFL